MSIDRAKAQKAAQKYLAKGQIDRAISEYEKVVSSDPSDARSLLKLGDLYTRQGDNRGAVGAYRKVAAQYAAQGFFLKAVAVYKQILKLDGNDLAAIEALADMYEKLSLASDALAAYEQVADAHARNGKPEKALLALGRMAELDKENVAAWIRYAEGLSKADRIDEASNAFRRGADLLKQQGRMEDFIKVTERLLFHSQDDLERARELAQIYIERGLGKAALSHLQTCFKADPRDVATLELLARAFAQLGQSVKATSVYKEIARIHADAGRVAEEQAVLRALLELEPDDVDAQRRLQALTDTPREESQTIELLESDEDLDEVVVVEDDASSSAARRSAPPLEDWEREAQIARLMAECEVFLRYGLRDKVVAQLQRVLEIDPNHLDAREKLKDTYLKRSEVSGAVTQLRMLAQLVGSSEPDKARAYLDQALALRPGDASITAQLASLLRGELRGSADDEDELIILDGDESGVPPPPRTAPPAFGPRETSLATALEGAEEPELVFEDDDEPELTHDDEPELTHDDEPELTHDDEPEPELELERQTMDYGSVAPGSRAELEPEDDEEEELPDELAEAFEEANFYLAQKLFDEAREVLIDVLMSFPKHPALQRKLSELDRAEGVEEPAPEDKSFVFAQKLAAESGAAPQAPTAVEQVLHQFKEGVRRHVDRSDTATHYDLGIAYMEMALHNEAIEEFKLCLDNAAQVCTAHTMIGLSYVAKGEMESGIDHFKQALRSPIRKPAEELGLWFEIGNACELLGKTTEALIWFGKVEHKDVTFRDVSRRIERLEQSRKQPQEVDEFDAMFDNMIIKE